MAAASTNPTSAGRIGWVDCAKGIGILLVVFGHNWYGFMEAGIVARDWASTSLKEGIYSFHMPLFFVLAGLFAWRTVARPAGEFVAERARDLLYPYVLWSCLQGVSANLLAGARDSAARFEPYKNLLIKPYAQFWFLYALFLCYALLLVLSRLRLGPKAISAVAAAWYGTQYFLPSLGQWGMAYEFRNYFFYFALGLAGRDWLASYAGPRRHTPALLVLSAGLYTVVGLCAARGWAHEPFRAPLIPLAGIVASIALAAACDAWRVPGVARLGQLSLPIFLAQVIAAAGTRIVLQKFLHVESLAVHMLAGMVVGVAGPVALYRAAQRCGFGFLFTLKGRERSPAARGHGAAAPLDAPPACVTTPGPNAS